MLSAQTLTGKLMAYAYQEPDFLKGNYLKDRIANLVDILRLRVNEKGIEESSKSIHNELFELRLELLESTYSMPELFKSITKSMTEDISKEYYLKSSHKQLGRIFGDALETYIKIYFSLNEIINNYKKPDRQAFENFPKLSELRNTLALNPLRDLENYIKWIEYSLNFECAIIISDLIFYDVIHLKKNTISELESFIKKSITGFGSYSILTGVWMPEENDESQLVRNIKIRSASIDAEQGNTIKYSEKKLYHLIHN